MNMITVHYDNIANVSLVPECKLLLTDYTDVFNGEMGSISGQVCLQVETVTLHTTAPGHMPVSLISQVKKEEPRVIVPVNVPTDWNS